MAETVQPPLLFVVDDDEGMLVLMAETLRAEGYTIATAGSARGAHDWLEQNTPALMILDLKLPDAGGPELVASLQRDRAPVPFVVVTGQGDEKVAVEVMKQGALDYVMKDTGLLDLLPTIVRRALATVAQGQALIAAQLEHKRLEQEIFAVSERERHTIGADLHDGLGQQLTALELMCAVLKADAQGQPLLTNRLAMMGKMLREAITQTRFLARGLVPVGSEPDALQIGLTELAGRIDSLGRLHCKFHCPHPIAVPDTFVAGHLYRIAQEAANNAMKHSRAKTLSIQLTQPTLELVLEISDDGVGLPNASTPTTGGLGLGVMQHRAAVIGAELSIHSKPGAGVTIRCRRPHRA